MAAYQLSHLRALEAEAIDILREMAAERERPCLLFSGGKDSIVLLRLAEKAFRPSDLPFPLLNVDTGHNFPELIEFRDRRADQLGARLIVRTASAVPCHWSTCRVWRRPRVRFHPAATKVSPSSASETTLGEKAT